MTQDAEDILYRACIRKRELTIFNDVFPSLPLSTVTSAMIKYVSTL